MILYVVEVIKDQQEQLDEKEAIIGQLQIAMKDIEKRLSLLDAK